jgi:hypothetical protein
MLYWLRYGFIIEMSKITFGSQENSDEPSLSDTLWPTVYYSALTATSLLLKNSTAQFYTLLAGFVLCIYFLNSKENQFLKKDKVFKFLWSILLKNSIPNKLLAGFLLYIYLNSKENKFLEKEKVFKFLWTILLTLEILVVGLIIGELIAAQMHFTTYGVISPTPFSTVITLVLMWFISSFFDFIPILFSFLESVLVVAVAALCVVLLGSLLFLLLLRHP